MRTMKEFADQSSDKNQQFDITCLQEDRLPDLPSALIRVAVSDLALCQITPGYIINMTEWHTPTKSGICQVCLVGSLMAMTYKMPRILSSGPGDFNRKVDKKMDFLDTIRKGGSYGLSVLLPEIGIAFNEKKLEALCDIIYDSPSATYLRDHDCNNGSPAFKQALLDIATQLEQAGLWAH